MPGFIVNIVSSVNCAHGAKATIAPGQPRVKVGGQFAAVLSDVTTVAGLSFSNPGRRGHQASAVREGAMDRPSCAREGEPTVCARAEQHRHLPERRANSTGPARHRRDAGTGKSDLTVATHIHFPFRIDGLGRTATADEETYIRQLIEQVLFTQQGERVNRPNFGSGLMQMVFQPVSDQLTTAVQFLVQGALQQWLGDLIVVEEVAVSAVDSTLEVTVRYLVRRTQERRTASFSREVPA